MHDLSRPGGTTRLRAPAALVGGVLAVLTASGYLIGAGRAFGYDASVTMANFVVGDTGDVFTRQVVFNNHPLFSFAEHVVWRLTGSTSEAAMRVAPALFAAAAVGLMAWRVAARHGGRAGVAAGICLAAHPFLIEGRDARGYTLAVLAIVVMGVFVLDRPHPVGFAAALAVGLATQLYVVVPGVALVGFLAVGGRLDRRWRQFTAAGMTVGFASYLGMARQMGRGGRLFRPDFPADALYELLGGSAVAVAAAIAVVAVAAIGRPLRKDVAAATGILAAGTIAPWLLAPVDLYPRFTFYAVPALAYAMALAASRWRWPVALTAVFGIAAVAPLIPRWTADELPNRELARSLPPGVDVCAVGTSARALQWYVPELRAGEDCALGAILMGDPQAEVSARARRIWPVLCWSRRGAELRSTGACPDA